MAYQSWSVVFGEQPSAAKWNILGTNDESFHDGTGIDNDVITAAKLLNGTVYRRQGGSATDWNVAGTTTYDVSATDVKVQMGNRNYIGGGDLTITYPVAYTNKPLIFVSTQGDSNITQNSSPEVVSTGTSSFTVRAVANAALNLEVSWMSIGV